MFGFGDIIGTVGGLIASNKKTKVPVSARSEAFLNLDVRDIDPSFQYPDGYTPTTVKAPLYPTDLPNYTGLPNLPDMPLLPAVFAEAGSGERSMQDALGASRMLLEAALNPNSDIFKRVAENDEFASRSDFLSGVRDLQRMNRKAKMMGRVGLYGDERGDEGFARSLMENMMLSRRNARDNARGYLVQGSNNYNSLAGQYGSLAERQRQRGRDFVSDLTDRLAQMRGDITNRLSVARADRTKQIDTERADRMGRVDQQRADVYQALSIANPQREQMANVGYDLQARKAANEAARWKGAQQLGNMDYGKDPSFGGMPMPVKNLGTAMPWLGA